MMQQSTGLHSVLNSLNNKGKVSVDGTPKDAVCKLYFNIQLNQLQLAAELSDQETKGRMHWQQRIERYHLCVAGPSRMCAQLSAFHPTTRLQIKSQHQPFHLVCRQH